MVHTLTPLLTLSFSRARMVRNPVAGALNAAAALRRCSNKTCPKTSPFWTCLFWFASHRSMKHGNSKNTLVAAIRLNSKMEMGDGAKERILWFFFVDEPWTSSMRFQRVMIWRDVTWNDVFAAQRVMSIQYSPDWWGCLANYKSSQCRSHRAFAWHDGMHWNWLPELVKFFFFEQLQRRFFAEDVKSWTVWLSLLSFAKSAGARLK